MDFEQPDRVDLFGDVDIEQLLSEYLEKQIQVCITNIPPQLQSILTNNKLANLSDQIKKIKACNTKQVYVLTTNSNTIYKANFVIDTAAEAYVISDKSLFWTIQECKTMVSQGGAKTLEITGYGNVYIEFTDSKEKMLLQNCLYMPQIGINLISQGKL